MVDPITTTEHWNRLLPILLRQASRGNREPNPAAVHFMKEMLTHARADGVDPQALLTLLAKLPHVAAALTLSASEAEEVLRSSMGLAA